MQVVLLSGRIRAGKSTLAGTLRDVYGVHVVKSRAIIARALRGISYERRQDFQKAGEDLDNVHGGTWLATGLYEEIETADAGNDAIWVLDSVRTREQVDAIRRAYQRAVIHVHLSVSEEAANARMLESGNRSFKEAASYEEAQQSQTEAHVEQLREIADIAIDTERDRPEDVVVRVAGHLGLLYVAPSSYVDVLIGGQYGSEGKGHIAWHLAREYDYLVRVGGPNAGHKVPNIPNREDAEISEQPFTYHMLPSGTAESRARVILGAGTTIDKERLRDEIAAIRLEVDRLVIDGQAVVIEDEDRKFECRSLRQTISSTAQGGGYAAARRLMRNALEPGRPVKLARDDEDLRPYVRPIVPLLEHAFSQGARIFVEGTQGSGLSLLHGPYPHVTSRDTNIAALLSEAGIAPALVRRVILVVRTYPIRVQDPEGATGATSGPMSQELTLKDIAARSGLPLDELERTERTSTTNRKRRIGEFDWVLFRRAVHLNAPTDIALTFADYLCASNRYARRLEQLDQATQRFIHEVERIAGAPVSMISTGFSTHNIIDRRTW
ncbi:MAG: adenylosuccinate synthetase [Bryobacteraceae bacterium]